MSVFQVNAPGRIYLDEVGNPDQESGVLLSHLESNYVEAILALDLFESSRTDLREYMRTDAHRQEGSTPRIFMMRAPVMHARSFIYSLDGFSAILGVMKEKPHASDKFSVALDAFNAEFPKLRDVRNSAHHMEDRVRRLKTGGKPIDVQPVHTDTFIMSGKGMVLDSLVDNRYATTLASGHYGEVEVSAASVSKLQVIYQALLDGIKWHDDVSRWGGMVAKESYPIIK